MAGVSAFCSPSAVAGSVGTASPSASLSFAAWDSVSAAEFSSTAVSAPLSVPAPPEAVAGDI